MTNAINIYNKVEDLVQTYNTRNPEELCNCLDIQICYNIFESLLGMYTCLFGRRIILLNSLLSPETAKMILAHELGHDILHRDGAVSKNGIADFKEFTLTCKTGTLEYEANAFCAHLLIPTEDFLEYIKSGLTAESIASVFGVDLNIVLIKGRELQKMGYEIKNCDTYDSCFLRNKIPG